MGHYEAGLCAHPTRPGAQALRLRHPAGLDLRRADEKLASAYPRQNPPANTV